MGFLNLKEFQSFVVFIVILESIITTIKKDQSQQCDWSFSFMVVYNSFVCCRMTEIQTIRTKKRKIRKNLPFTIKCSYDY